MVWRQHRGRVEGLHSHAHFLQILFQERILSKMVVNEKWNLNVILRDWKLGKIPPHLNSSKQAICYPLSFSGTDEQVVFRRSLSIFSFWNLSNSKFDWLFLPHDNSKCRHHAGFCLGFSGGESWERICCWGGLFDNLKVRPVHVFFCSLLSVDVPQLPFR